MGPGRPDVVFQRGNVIVFVDLVSGAADAVNLNILQAAANAALMGYTVHVVRSGLYEYTTPGGTRVPSRMDASVASTIGLLCRLLYLVLNVILPMLTDAAGMWRAVIVPVAYVVGGPISIPVIRAWLPGFPLLDNTPLLRRVGPSAGLVPARKTGYWDGQAFGIVGFMTCLVCEGVHFANRLVDMLPHFPGPPPADPVGIPANVLAPNMWVGPWSSHYSAFQVEPDAAFNHLAFPRFADFIGNAAYATLTGRLNVAAVIAAGIPHSIEPTPALAVMPLFYTQEFRRVVVIPQNMPAAPALVMHPVAAAHLGAAPPLAAVQRSYL